METISTSTLKEDASFTGDLLIDSNFLLLPQTAPVTKQLIDSLKEWEFDTLTCDGNLSLGGDIGVSHEEEDKSNEKGSKIGEAIKRAIENSKKIKTSNSDQARMNMVQSVYDEYMNYIESMFNHYATHKTIDYEELSETVQELCVFTKENKSYILRINPTEEETHKNFLVIHSMRTAVIAIAIALHMHMPLSKMIDLGVTCFIHEIGMLRLPPQIYMTDRRLTPGEKLQIYKHPLLGYAIMKELNFPLTVQLGVLEHHENENGNGYPRKLDSEKISTAAKIIAIACSYEAITSPRGYKEERSSFDAILEILQNREHKYDDSIVKALLYTVSLYPIGSYVFLSNHKPGIVVDTNPLNPKCPVVQILTERESDGSFKTVKTGENGISIVRILSKQEKEDLSKLLKEQNKAEEEALNNSETTEELSETPKAKVTAPAKPEAAKSKSEGTEEIDISFFN